MADAKIKDFTYNGHGLGVFGKRKKGTGEEEGGDGKDGAPVS